MRHSALAAVAAVGVVLSLCIPAGAVTYLPSQTFRAGTKVACVLDETINSRTLGFGTDFRLRVVDVTHPALHGAEIHGIVTDVTQPHGINRARIGFLIRTIHLRNGRSKPIHAYVVNRQVVQYNPAAARAARQALPPAVPYGTVTPGPVAWQMRIGGGGVTIGEQAAGEVGGYIYAGRANEAIVIPSGSPVTIELASDLTIP